MKRIIALILTLSIGFCPILSYADELIHEIVKEEKDSFVIKLTLKSGPTIKFNDTDVSFKPSAFVENGVVYAPARPLLEGLGFYVIYDEEAKIITGLKYNIANNIAMQIGTNWYVRNGKLVKYDVAPLVKDGSTYVPAHIIYELLGYNVSYDETKETLTVTEK